MFWSKNKKKVYIPVNPSFTILFVTRTCFRDVLLMNVTKQNPTNLAVLGMTIYSLSFVISQIIPPINKIEVNPCLPTNFRELPNLNQASKG